MEACFPHGIRNNCDSLSHNSDRLSHNSKFTFHNSDILRLYLTILNLYLANLHYVSQFWVCISQCIYMLYPAFIYHKFLFCDCEFIYRRFCIYMSQFYANILFICCNSALYIAILSLYLTILFIFCNSAFSISQFCIISRNSEFISQF